MFVSEKIVYTELHKTGGTHIGQWLAQLVNGQQIGKHNRIPAHLWDRFIVGSVRNPWDWYVSLWAYGCGKQGSVYNCTTRKYNMTYYNSQLHPEMGLKRTSLKYSGLQLWHDLLKPVDIWRSLYHDYQNADAFKQWLRMLFDPRRRFDVGEGYGFSPVNCRYGLMTYRLLKLYSRLGNELYRDPALKTWQGMQNVWQQNKLLNHMIRNEFLESDFLLAMDKAGYQLTDEQQQAVLAGREQKTNTSKRLTVDYYYDQEILDIVNEREQLIIKEFGYAPLNINEKGHSK